MKFPVRLLTEFVLCSVIIPLFAQQMLVGTAALQKIRMAGFFRSGNWAVAKMKKWGFQNTALEPWGNYSRSWEIEEFNTSMKQPHNNSIFGPHHLNEPDR